MDRQPWSCTPKSRWRRLLLHPFRPTRRTVVVEGPLAFRMKRIALNARCLSPDRPSLALAHGIRSNAAPTRGIGNASRKTPPPVSTLYRIQQSASLLSHEKLATQSAVYVAMKHIFPDVPINAGCFAPIHIAPPDGTFLYARYPRPVAGCAAEVAQRIMEAVFGAMGNAIPERLFGAPAGTSGNFGLGGYDPGRFE
jgi:hypothetical protein